MASIMPLAREMPHDDGNTEYQIEGRSSVYLLKRYRPLESWRGRNGIGLLTDSSNTPHVVRRCMTLAECEQSVQHGTSASQCQTTDRRGGSTYGR